jgi:hypothetical protein
MGNEAIRDDCERWLVRHHAGAFRPGGSEVDAVVVLVTTEQRVRPSELVDTCGKSQARDGEWNQDRRAEAA